MPLEPTEREEHFFKAMVDAANGSTPEELEPTERKEHWYKEIIDAIKSGGGGVLVVHETVSGKTHTLDKTWQEIHDAACVVFMDSEGFVTYLSMCDEFDGYNADFVAFVNNNLYTSHFNAASSDGYPSYTFEVGGGSQ